MYLEDIQTTVTSKSTVADDSGPPPSSAGPNDPTPTAAVAVKRQRTLMDMLGGSHDGAKDAKKTRLSASASSAPKKNANSLGLPKLNSIPFSLSKFQDSLSEEQRRLLQLECEVMGKSWSVANPFFPHYILIGCRLKLLKTEVIRFCAWILSFLELNLTAHQTVLHKSQKVPVGRRCPGRRGHPQIRQSLSCSYVAGLVFFVQSLPQSILSISQKHLLVVEHTSRQGQSRHCWPRSLSRCRPSAW